MVRLLLDDLTHKILGYEDVTEFIQTYSDDVFIDAASPDVIGCYYENGEIIKEDRNDYHTNIEKLEEQLSEQSQILSNKSEKVAEAILNNTLDDLRIQMKNAEEQITMIESQINELEERHKRELDEFYLQKDKEKDKLVVPKYFSSLCLLIKNETQYLKEWIDYHIGLGFDHIFIYDNGSEAPVQDAINAWYAGDPILDKITVVDFSGRYKNLQTECYNHFLENYRHETRWIAFIDSDEFIRITDYTANTVNEFLSNKEDYTTVSMDFVEYGADGQETYDDRPVRERFTTPVTVNDGIYHKEFIQPNRIDRMRTHYPIFNEKKHKTLEKDKERVVIDHYYTKSWEEWQKKMERGSCDPGYLKRSKEFFLYNPDMVYLYDGTEQEQGYHG